MSWTFQVPFFKEKMNLIIFHNRGVGKSSRPDYPYTMEMFVEDIKNFLEHLDIKKKIHLCGISMGGMIAQHFVIKYPDLVKTLILCATSAKYDPTPVVEAFRLMEQFELEEQFMIKAKNLYSRTFIKRLKQDNDLYEALKNEFVIDATRLQDIVNQAAAISNHDTSNLLQTINHPTLIIGGTKDRIIPTAEHSILLHSKIPNSKLEILEGLGHGFNNEIPDKTNEIIWNFIKQHLS